MPTIYFIYFFESKFKLPHRTNGAVERLLKVGRFLSGMRSASDPRNNLQLGGSKLAALVETPFSERKSTRAIIELRGYLRHHSLGNPARWDPLNQKKYEREARFLALVAQEIAHPDTHGLSWDDVHASEFRRQADEWGFMTKIRVHLTYRDDGVVREGALDMTFPTETPNASLARAALERTLQAFSEKSPAAELLGLRAVVISKNQELFRYDLGPGLLR